MQSAPGWWSTPPLILRYGLSFVFVAGALAIAIWLEDHLVGAPVPLFLCAIMFVAWFGGIGPGLIAIGLSILSFKYYFVLRSIRWLWTSSRCQDFFYLFSRRFLSAR
jgi:K+-sensing histidine kinase KdpD